MASDVKLNGTDAIFYVNGTAVAHSTDLTMSISMETRDITDKSSSGWNEVAEGRRSASCSGTAWVNPTSSLTADDISDFIENRTKVSVNAGKTSTSGDFYYNFQGYFTDFSINYPLEDTVSFDFDFAVTGAVSKLTTT